MRRRFGVHFTKQDMHKFKIGDTALRADRSVEPVRWVETIINETYLPLTREFPEDYKRVMQKWEVTGTLYGAIIFAESEGEARRIFHRFYNGMSITHVRNVPSYA